MASAHGRYEELAVGHVLGGLSSRQTAEFRNHLHQCGECRTRVAELNGIADDLEAAEREERARTPVRTEQPPREPDESAPEPRSPIGVGHVTVAVVIVLVLGLAMAFWNLHLRTTAAAYLGVAEAQGEVLTRLAGGVELDATTAEGVEARVVTDGQHVTVTLTGLAVLGTDERLVAWFGGAPEPEQTPPRVLAGPGELEQGAVARSLPTEGARHMTISREVGRGQGAPAGEVVLEVRLVADAATASG